jgi:hypothetical protein
MGGKGSGGPRYGKDGRKAQTPMVQASDPSNVDAEVNSRVMAFGRELMAFEPPDFSDAASVEQRFYDYLGMCDRHGIRPMVTSMANAFGMNRHELWRIATDDRGARGWRGGILTPESAAVIKKSYNFLNTAWETYLMCEKGNPVKWIFMGKNYFGMKDQSEQVQVRMDVTPELPAAEEVVAKYAAMVGAERPAIETPAEVEDAEPEEG